MKTLTSIEAWLVTKPSKENVERVLKLINRIESTQVRREVYELEKRQRKLISIEKKMKELKIKVPTELQQNLTNLKTSIDTLKKGLPVVNRKPKVTSKQ